MCLSKYELVYMYAYEDLVGLTHVHEVRGSLLIGCPLVGLITGPRLEAATNVEGLRAKKCGTPKVSFCCLKHVVKLAR